jgi:integrase
MRKPYAFWHRVNRKGTDFMAVYTRNKDGYYRASIVTGYTSNGKQKRETIRSKSLTEFKELVKHAENLRDQGYDFDSKNMTVSQWALKWFEIYKTPRVRTGTASSYESDLRLHILPVIGHRLLTDIKPYMLQDILNAQKGNSTSHAEKIRITLQQLFRRAYIDGLVVKDVSDGLIMPSTVAGTRRPLTENERAAVIKIAENHRAGLWILTMLYCGLRPEETVALMWHDINFTEGKEALTVQRAAEWINGRAGIKCPKGKDKKQGEEARRTIPSPQPLVERLKKADHKGLYVFTPEQSTGMLTKSNTKKMWHSFHRDVDIEMGVTVYRNQIIEPHTFAIEITPYYLRHTYATDLFEMGVDLKTAQYLLGHADIETTANIYTHFMERSLDKAGDIIRGHFKARGQIGDIIESV